MNALTRGADGLLYGLMFNSVYRISSDGVYAHVATTGDGYPYDIGERPPPLIWGTDGRIYGGSAFGWLFRVTLPRAVVGFDADNKADLPFYDRTSGVWRILTSSSDYHSSRQIFWGGAGYTPVPADYDGDGRLDVAVYRAATASWWILTSRSAYTAVMSQAWGGIGYVSVPGDCDGDHKADVTVYRHATA